MTDKQKGKVVLVKCVVVDSDGYPVDEHGEMAGSKGKPFYTWEPRYRTFSWMKKHRAEWKNKRTMQ